MSELPKWHIDYRDRSVGPTFSNVRVRNRLAVQINYADGRVEAFIAPPFRKLPQAVVEDSLPDVWGKMPIVYNSFRQPEAILANSKQKPQEKVEESVR